MSKLVKTPLANYKKNTDNESACGLGIKVVKTKLGRIILPELKGRSFTMKRITARTALKLVFSFSWFIALALVRDARAGDYYMYRDSKGDLVISNNAPPPGSKIINKETLPEATDQQTSESAIRENNVALDDRIASLEKTIGDLAQNLRYQAEVIDNLQQSHGDTNIAVGVTQAPAIVGSRPYDKSNRPPNFRNNLSRGNPRPVVPMSPSQRGGGRAG